MPLDTVDSLIEALRGRPILRPDQFEEMLRRYAPAASDTQDLARTLIRLRWLTVYQAKKLISGKGHELVIGPYVVLDKLGEGGMGKVYKATQLSLGRVVALKVVRGSLLKNETVLKRFLREVKTAADLNHPNIVRVFDSDQVADRHFLAMEYIEGVDLAKLVKDRGPLPVAMAASYVRQAALGLQHAHDRKMVHRDIKPSNLLAAVDGRGQYTPRNVVRVLDMGLARIHNEEGDGEHISTELTRTGTVIGTPDFMSPEQAKNSSTVDRRSDLYSLGCTFYYLLAGEVPFPNGSPLEKLLQHQMDPPRAIQLLRTDVPPELGIIIHTLLAKKPEDRFQSGAALAHALEPWSSTAGQSGLLPTMVLPAEAVDPATVVLETDPNDPFDFGEPAETPEPTRRPSPPSPRESDRLRTAGRGRQGFAWVPVVTAVLVGILAIGMLWAAIAVFSNKKGGNASPGTPDPTRTDPVKSPVRPRVEILPPGMIARHTRSGIS